MWQGSPHLQQYQFMRAVLEMLDFHDPEKYLYDDQQVGQMQQAAMQQQLQMQMAGMAMQSELQTKQQEGELIRDVVKSLLK